MLTPQTIQAAGEWGLLILKILTALGSVFEKAFAKKDWSVFDKPVRELLPKTLRITLARKQAEAEAVAKFKADLQPSKRKVARTKR